MHHLAVTGQKSAAVPSTRPPPRSYSLTAAGKKSRRGWKVLVAEQWVESTLQKLGSPHDTLWHDLRSQRECVFCAVHFQAPAKSFSSLLWGNRFGHGEMRVTQNGNLYSQICNLSLFHSLAVASTNASRNDAKKTTPCSRWMEFVETSFHLAPFYFPPPSLANMD